jgi:signal transduction histidine kinase
MKPIRHLRSSGAKRHLARSAKPVLLHRKSAPPAFHTAGDALVVANEVEQSFSDTRAPYGLLAGSIHEGALILLNDGTILHANARFAEMANEPVSRIIGGNWRRFFSPKEQAGCDKLLHKAETGSSKDHFTLQIHDAPGLPVEVSVRALKDDEMEGFSVLVTDVTPHESSETDLRRAKEQLEQRVRERTAELTRANDRLLAEMAERKRAEQELNLAQEQLRHQARDLEAQVAERTAHLQATNKSLETLCYSMAHDLRAPNRSVQGFAELLLSEHADQLDSVGRGYLKRIVAAAARNDCLILDMLAYGRLGHAPLPCSEQSLEATLETVLQHLASDIKSKNAKVNVSYPLPRALANPTALEETLTNLLTNALKFVAPGVIPEVSIWAHDKGDSVRLCIQDNGLGIKREHHEVVFKVFERLHSAEAYPGTGIGLAIVQKAVERMGGRVGLESEPGKGSLFWIELLKPEAGNPAL